MSVTFRQFYKPLAIAAALAFLYFTVAMKLGNDWWHDENYSHGLLIPFVIGFILWQERDGFRQAESRSAAWWLGSFGIGVSLLALWAGTAGAELFVQRASLVLMLASIVIYFFGFRLLRVAAVPLMLLALSIPIPQIIFNRIAFPLQLFASRCAVSAMSFFSIPVLRQGNMIELMPLGATQPKKLAVVEACSGIRSLMTLVTLAMIYAYFTRPKSGNKTYGVLRFAHSGSRRSPDCNSYKCAACQRHRSPGALLRHRYRRRVLSFIFGMGDLHRGCGAVACDWMDYGSRRPLVEKTRL